MSVSLKVCVIRYSVVEIRKHNMDFSEIFLYYGLLSVILLQRQTSADFQICQYNSQMFHIIATFSFSNIPICERRNVCLQAHRSNRICKKIKNQVSKIETNYSKNCSQVFYRMALLKIFETPQENTSCGVLSQKSYSSLFRILLKQDPNMNVPKVSEEIFL